MCQYNFCIDFKFIQDYYLENTEEIVVEFEINKAHKQQQVWTDTAEMLDTLKDIYNDRQAKEFGVKAKKVSKTEIIHNLVMMKLREELENV